MTDAGEETVRFTVKELLIDLKGDIKGIDAKLDLKADSELVHGLATRLDALEDWRNRVLGAVAVAILAVPFLTGLVVYALNHR